MRLLALLLISIPAFGGTDPVERAARKLFLENAVCAADLERTLADARKKSGGRLDGTTLYRRRMSREKADATFAQSEKQLKQEFGEKFDLVRCGTPIQAARIQNRKPIPAPNSGEHAKDWASTMPEPTVAALLCLRQRSPAAENATEKSISEALDATYQRRFGPFDPARCSLP